MQPVKAGEKADRGMVVNGELLSELRASSKTRAKPPLRGQQGAGAGTRGPRSSRNVVDLR